MKYEWEFLKNVIYKLLAFAICSLFFVIVAGLLNRYLLSSFLSDNMVALIAMLLAAVYVLFKMDVPLSKQKIDIHANEEKIDG